MNTILESTNILGTSVTTSPKGEILEYIQSYLELSNYPIIQLSNKKRKPLVVVTPNPEQIVLAQEDKHFAQILNQADVAIPDGIGLVVAMRLLAQSSVFSRQSSVLKRIPGVEFMEELVELAAKHGWPVAFIGGREGVAEEALLRLKKKYPGLIGWVRELPEISVGDLGDISTLGDVINKIKKTNTKLVFVGLGAPKQEFFIHRLMSNVLHPTSPMVFMAVGGSFDTIAGRVKRAPLVIRSMGFEWLWRLVLEPWRWKRQLALVTFMWLVLRKKVGSIDIL